ncbi:MAG: mitochondrial fission protein ELM1 [Desulforhopalus sp.]|jgi:mitochondrial fission protein ELM1
MGNSDKNAVDVVIVVDGRPGHEKQSFGIVQSLGNRISVKTTVIDISKRGFWGQVLSYIKLLFSFGSYDFSLPENADLVIGTGTRTHSTVLNIKKHFQVPAITCMTPGRHLRNLFDICFVPEHDGSKKRDNYFFTCGAPNNCVDKKQHEEKKGLILLGGVDENSHTWDSNVIEKKITQIISREKGTTWIISSSPRTPQVTVEGLQKIINKADNVQFFDYKDTQKGWIEEQYTQCATVWVTSDSISMLYEALSSGCRVNVIQMPWKKNSSKFKRNEDLLIDKSLVTPFSSWERGEAKQSVVSQLNEAQRCADYIILTCWPKN